MRERPTRIAAGIRVDDADLHLFAGQSLYVGSNGYAYVSTNAEGPRTVHSVILGGTPRGQHIDHINGDKLDNRRVNLRVVSPQLNQVNRKRLSAANRSGHRGVSRTPVSRANPWRAQIMVDRRAIHLGLFPTVEDAIRARRAAEIHYFGEECPR